MRIELVVVFGILGAALVGCGDDGGNAIPDTVIDSAPSGLGREPHVRIEFHAQGQANHFVCSLDAATPAACESPFEADVADGPHTFAVSASFGQLLDGTPAMAEWTVDATPPDTAIALAPPALDNSPMPTITFLATGETEGTFECQLDAAAFAACTSPTTLTVGDGAHTFAVRAIDLAGNVDATPATTSWTVDTSTPDTTITSGPAAGATTGPAVAFEFESNKPGATFECLIDNGVFEACATPFPATFTDGPHSFAVRAKDSLGVVDPSPASRLWTVDAAGPTVTITSGPPNPTNDATPTFAFAASEAGSTFECQLDTGTFAPCTTPFTAPTLSEASHTFTVRATDPAGNLGGTASATFVVDLTPPALTITSAPAALSNDTTPTVAFTTGADAVLRECQVDAGAFAACTSPFTTTVAEGMHSITVRATDAAGNAATRTAAFTVDTTPPTVTITAAPAALSNDTTPTVAFTVAPAPMTVTCKVDAGAAVACSSPFTTTVGEGAHTILITATDAAANPGTAMTTFTVDTTPPTLSITSGPTGPTNDNTPTFGFTTVGAATIDCRIDTAAFATCTSPFTAATLPDGPHTFAVRATDAAGNPATATRSFTVDTVAPTITVTSQPGPLTNNPAPVIQFTTAGNPTMVTCSLDGGAPVTCTTSFTPPSPLADGSHTVVITATDAAGNPGTATVTFTVDQTPPTVAFTATPPAKWPVNYFDFSFTAPGATSATCSLNGAVPTPCTIGATITITSNYNTPQSFVVKAKDAAGNTGSKTATWTPTRDLVLHYPFEQGSTTNTSLLAQVPALSPNGSVASVAFVGGYAGAAIGRTVAAHTYGKTVRALSSSSDGSYTGGFWIRPTPNGIGTIFSTKTTSGGMAITVKPGNAAEVTVVLVEANGASFSGTGLVPWNRWTNVEFRTTGVSKDLQVFFNGALAFSVDAINATGFGAGQASALTVGPFTGLDIDDLRFYNIALSDSAICARLANGAINPNGACDALKPYFEFDFEGDSMDTGSLGMFTNPIPGSFSALSLGQAIKIGNVDGGVHGMAQASRFAPGRSFAFWFGAGGTAGRLFNYSRNCNNQAPPVCGLIIVYNGTTDLAVYAGTVGSSRSVSISGVVAGRPNSVLVTEQRSDITGNTTQITVYLNGTPTVIGLGNDGDIFGYSSGDELLLPVAGQTIDEFEFWPTDLSANSQLLCDVGLDGESDPVTGTCGLANN